MMYEGTIPSAGSDISPVRQRRRILVVGHARHGKDTVAEILRDQHGMTFASSSWTLAEVCCRPYLAARGITYDSIDECYADRVNHRAAWHDAISEFNRDDPTSLARVILAKADIYVGMRSNREYRACLDAGLFDAIWWVDASGRGVPPEPRDSCDIDFNPECMTLIDNSRCLLALQMAVSVEVNALP